MPAVEKIKKAIRRNSDAIWTGVGIALVTPLLVRVVPHLTETAVNKGWKLLDTLGTAGSEGATGTAGVQCAGEPDYTTWTKDELYDLAKTLDISGRSTMNKGELIEVLRKHQPS